MSIIVYNVYAIIDLPITIVDMINQLVQEFTSQYYSYSIGCMMIIAHTKFHPEEDQILPFKGKTYYGPLL